MVVDLISLLRDRKTETRKLTSARLSKNRSQSAGPLVEVLSLGNLSQKIGALGILEEWSAPIAGVDPWEPDTITAGRLELLGVWLQEIAAPN